MSAQPKPSPEASPSVSGKSSASTSKPASSSATPSSTVKPTSPAPSPSPTSIVTPEQCATECETLRLTASDSAAILANCNDASALRSAGRCYLCSPSDASLLSAASTCKWNLSELSASATNTASIAPSNTSEPIKPLVITRPAEEPASSSGLSTNVKIAIGITAAVVPLLILLGVISLYYRRRRQESAHRDLEKTAANYESDTDNERQQPQTSNIPPHLRGHPAITPRKPEDQDLEAALRSVSHANQPINQTLSTPVNNHDPSRLSTHSHRRTGSTPRSSLDKRLPDSDDVYVVHMFVQEDGRSSAVVSCEAHIPSPSHSRSPSREVHWADQTEPAANTSDGNGGANGEKHEDAQPWVRGHRPRLSLQTTNLPPPGYRFSRK